MVLDEDERLTLVRVLSAPACANKLVPVVRSKASENWDEVFCRGILTVLEMLILSLIFF